MGNVSYARERNCNSKLICERRQILFDRSTNKSILIGLELRVECFIEFESQIRVVVWSIVLAVFTTLDLPARNKVKVGSN